MRMTIQSGDTLDWNAQGVEQIKNNILNLLRTWRGEVPYLPGLGLDPDLLDQPGPQMRAALTAQVREQLRRYEPSATLAGLALERGRNGDMTVSVEVEL